MRGGEWALGGGACGLRAAGVGWYRVGEWGGGATGRRGRRGWGRGWGDTGSGEPQGQ